MVPSALEALDPISCSLHFESLTAEVIREHLGHGLVVLDDQNLRHAVPPREFMSVSPRFHHSCDAGA